MQSRRFTAASPKKRRGFTLIELLVVISIIATLMSLILPAIQNAREAGRRTQCLNNIRNVTVAALNFASSNKSRLPALAYFPTPTAASASGARILGRSWAVEMLPYMDQQGTYDRWNKDVAFNAPPNLALASTLYVEAFACPNDESAFVTPGGLSYVANTGFGDGVLIANFDTSTMGPAVQHSFSVESIDWDGDGVVNDWAASTIDPDDQKITQGTGVFWPEFQVQASDTPQQQQMVRATRNASATIGKIYDGSGNTIMFGENLNAGGTNWADPRTRANGFMLPLNVTGVNGTAAATSFPNIHNLLGTDPNPPGGLYPAYPNEAKTGPEGQRPYLNSNHPGIVVVSMCDGSAKTISENIDDNVYTKLITPNGTRLRQGIAVESPLSADSF